MITLPPISLNHRLALIRANTAMAPKVTPNSRFLREKWQKLAAFQHGLSFEDRLSKQMITEEEAALLACEPTDISADKIEECIAQFDSIYRTEPLESLKGRSLSGVKKTPFLTDIVMPLVEYAAKQLKASCPAGADHLLSGVSIGMQQRLETDLRLLTRRVLILELNIFNLENKGLGDSFEEFYQVLHEPRRVVQIFREYLGLAFDVISTVHQAVNFAVELVARLHNDFQSLADTFAIRNAVLNQIVYTEGDVHNDGRRVVILEFPGDIKVVYKPRTIDVEYAHASVIQWIARETEMPMRTPKMLACEGYGWSEYIESLECLSQEQAARYYKRIGIHLAVAYVLNGNDIHYENILAHGEYPVVIDGETFALPAWDSGTEYSGDAAFQAFRYCVRNTGILPGRARLVYGPTATRGEKIDPTALGARIGQITLERSPMVQNEGKGSMHIGNGGEMHLEYVPASAKVDGVSCDPWQYFAEIQSGFVEAYRVFQRSDIGEITRKVIDVFDGLETRVVLRSSQIYAYLLMESRHPDYCVNPVCRDLLFESLWDKRGYFFNTDGTLILKEIEALWSNGIPYFQASTSSRDLLCSGSVIEREFFAKTGMERLRERIASISDDDCRLQLWYLNSTFWPNASIEYATCSPTESGHAVFGRYSETKRVRLARCIMDVIVRFAVDTSKGVVWPDYATLNHGDELKYSGSQANLFNGLFGVAIFAGAYSYELPDTKGTEILEKVVKTVHEIGAHGEFDGVSCGGYFGITSYLYTIATLSRFHPGVGDRLQEAKLLEKVRIEIFESHSFDLVHGVGGAALALLSYAECFGSSFALDLAVLCGEKLLKDGVRGEDYLCWPQRHLPPLTGLSHGSTGIGYALYRLWRMTNREEFLQGSLMALNFDKKHYVAEAENWADLRMPETYVHADTDRETGARLSCCVAWCHGAPGIGLALLDMHRDGFRQFEDRIHAAARTTLKFIDSGPGHAGLCHGDFGRLAYLLRYQKDFPTSPMYNKISEKMDEVINMLSQRLVGDEQIVSASGRMGFFEGYSGIGYEVVRMIGKGRLPEILLLKL